MFDWSLVVIGIFALGIGIYIYRMVQKVNAKINRKLGPAPSEMARKQLLEELRNRPLPNCPKCGVVTFAMIDTDSRYKCKSCDFEFEGAPHI